MRAGHELRERHAVPELYELLLQGFTECGYEGTDQITVTVDNTAPVSMISTPTNCETVKGTVEIRGTADDANLHSWTLQYTGGNQNGWTTIASGNNAVSSGVLATWDTTGLPFCTYTLRLRVRDQANRGCNTGNSHRTDYLVSVRVGTLESVFDFDGDGDVDLLDFSTFQSAFTGPMP